MRQDYEILYIRQYLIFCDKSVNFYCIRPCGIYNIVIRKLYTYEHISVWSMLMFSINLSELTMPRGSGSKASGSSGTRATKASSGPGAKASSSSGPAKTSSSSAKGSRSGATMSGSATKKSHSGMDELVSRTGQMKLEDKSHVYRVCRKDEDLSKDIVAKAKPGTAEAKRTVNQHINSGSKKASPYISATASPDVAREWSYYTKETPKDVRPRDEPRPIIKIDTSKMEGTSKPIDLTNESERQKHVSGATQINRVKSSQEVLFKDRIPKQNSRGENVFEEWKNPPKPNMPK